MNFREFLQEEKNKEDYHSLFSKTTDEMKPGTTKYVGRANNKEIYAKKDKDGNIKFYYKDGIKGSLRVLR